MHTHQCYHCLKIILLTNSDYKEMMICLLGICFLEKVSVVQHSSQLRCCALSLGIPSSSSSAAVTVLLCTQQYDEAEKAYQDVLKYDSNNEDAIKELCKCHTLQLMVRYIVENFVGKECLFFKLKYCMLKSCHG